MRPVCVGGGFTSRQTCMRQKLHRVRRLRSVQPPPVSKSSTNFRVYFTLAVIIAMLAFLVSSSSRQCANGMCSTRQRCRVASAAARGFQEKSAIYSTRIENGPIGRKGCQVYILDDHGNTISPWDDVSLRAGHGSFNFVVEIAAGMTEKMEQTKVDPYHHLEQDTNKDGSIRNFLYKSPMWNNNKGMPFDYGMLPQTWEDPEQYTQLEGMDSSVRGDGDAVDVVQLHSEALTDPYSVVGEVRHVKVLGSIALIDEGEMDWKVLVIDSNHPMYDEEWTDEQVQTYFKDEIEMVVDWFKFYKTADGKPVNELALDGQVVSIEDTLKMIDETHGFWNSRDAVSTAVE